MDVSEARRELVLRAQRGDRSALNELVTEAVPIVAALVRALAPGLRNQEDIVQEALVRVIGHLKSLRDPERFGAYLNEITRNLVFDTRRRRRAEVPLADEFPSGGEGPVERTLKDEEEAEVRRAVRALGGIDREIVLLRHWAGASYEEIASTLGLTVSAVQSRLFRARRELAARLRAFLKGEPGRKPHG